jgi:hypothetical protein
LVGFAAALIVDHFLFGMQRTTLLLSHELGVSKETTAILLPGGYKLSLIPISAKWALLVAIAIEASWWLAIGLAVFALAFRVVAPIPYTLYMRYFKKRFDATSSQLSDSQASRPSLDITSGYIEQFPKFSAEARSLRRLALCDELHAALEIKRKSIPGAYSIGAHQRTLYQYLLEPVAKPN